MASIIEVEYGALAPKLKDQLEAQGCPEVTSIDVLQGLADSITRLNLARILLE